jgi:hypothetical protein
MALKQVTREQWTTALRSGEYQQCRGALYSPSTNAYCCLGVLAVLAGGKAVGGFSGMKFDDVQTPDNRHLPLEVTGMVNISGFTEFELVRLNDRFHKSFSEIADYIDSLPPEAVELEPRDISEDY